jgi:pre-rRNA-processing protein TSR2
VQNQWGGPDSADKRDWLAGAISDVFENNPDTDALDVEVVLLQALEDEFGVRLEDETEIKVAEDIMRIRKECFEGNFGTVEELQKRWEERKGKAADTGNVRFEERQEDDGDSVDEESGEEDDEDVDMDEAPPLVSSKPKPVPEVDEDGFTKVVGRRR